jgi:hypothetical protein
MRRRHATVCIGLTLLFWCFAVSPQASWAGDSPQRWLASYYGELQQAAKDGPFGQPLQVRSEERSNLVSGEIRGIVDHPFETVASTFVRPGAWCDFLSLNPNIKACTFQMDGQETRLMLYIGTRKYRSPEAAVRQPYRFAVRTQQAQYAAISLGASEGLLGTKAHQFEFEAAGVAGRTVIALRSSYEPSALSRLITTIYLATAGRDNVGFSRQGNGDTAANEYVKGVQGMIERGVMRYYLALKAFLDARDVPGNRQFESRLSLTYDLMDRYPAQLRQMDKAEYLDIKRRERENQVRLQRELSAGDTAPNGP